MKSFDNALFFLLAAAACIFPLLWFAGLNSSTDLAITVLARTLASRLFWEHGFYHRVPQILSGIDPLPSGLFAIKLDSLFMGLVTSSTSVLLFLIARCVIFIVLTSIIFQKVYGASFRMSVGLAGCALAGLNILNWLYYSPDYVGGGQLGWGYPLFPLLLMPIAFDAKFKSIGSKSLIAFSIGLLYGMSSPYSIAVFASYVAVVWTITQINSPRGWAIASAGCVGVVLAITPELVRFIQTGAVGGTRSAFALFFDWRQTLHILVHRDFVATLLCLMLAGVAITIAVSRPLARTTMAILVIVYALSMFLDPAMKTVGAYLEGVLPTIVLSASYYSYVFSPIVLAAFFCASFRYVRGIAEIGLAIGLIMIALKLTSSSVVAELVPREGPSLSVIRELAQELQGRASGLQRAVIIRETEQDLTKSNWRLARLSPNHFAAFGLAMADGYIPNPDARYTLFMSNAAIPPSADSVVKFRFERNVVLNVSVSSHLKEASNGCIEQESAIALDDYFSLPVLQNAAVQYVISMFRLESRHLVLQGAGNPVFCRERRGEGRPFVYEFVKPTFRFALAREIERVDDVSAAYRVLRADPGFAVGNRVVVTREEAAKLRGPVSGIGNQSSDVKLVGDEGDRLRLLVSSPNDTLLIVRDSYSQPVSARAEGRELDVIRINGSFVGIRVPRGDRKLAMTFQ
jgi:hypothetical protein